MSRLFKIIIFLLAISGLSRFLQGRRPHMHAIKTDTKFYRQLGRRDNPFALVLFYRYNETNACKIRDLINTMSAVTNSWLYKEGGLQPLSVDIDRDDLDLVMKDFNVPTTPSFLLFKEGSVIVDDNNNNVILTGFATGKELKEFIDNNVLSDLQERVEEKAQIRREREESRYMYWYSWGPYWGPYNGYSYRPYYYGWPYYL